MKRDLYLFPQQVPVCLGADSCNVYRNFLRGFIFLGHAYKVLDIYGAYSG